MPGSLIHSQESGNDGHTVTYLINFFTTFLTTFATYFSQVFTLTCYTSVIYCE